MVGPRVRSGQHLGVLRIHKDRALFDYEPLFLGKYGLAHPSA